MRQDRIFVYDKVDISLSELFFEGNAKYFLPPFALWSDYELKKVKLFSKEAQLELDARAITRKIHEDENRVVYIYSTRVGGPKSNTFRIATRFKNWESGKNQHINIVSGNQEGIRVAARILERHDEGGVIWVKAQGWRDEPVAQDEWYAVDVRPNECDVLKETGSHDWRYDFMGGDICGSCGIQT